MATHSSILAWRISGTEKHGHSSSIEANHQSFIVLRTLNSATKSVGFGGKCGGGKRLRALRPKEPGRGGRGGEGWSPERQRGEQRK